MQGIYKITNKLNGKCYIGQSKCIENRWKRHNRDYKKRSSKLNDAIYKYGIENFTFEIIEEVIDSKKLLEREKHYKDIYNSVDNGYNAFKGLETQEALWEYAKKSKRKSTIVRQKKIKTNIIVYYPPRKGKRGIDKEIVCQE